MKKTRRVVQFGFLALVLGSVFVVGANCERWCPFGGVEAIHTYASEGNMLCSLGTSNFFILGGVLAMTLLVRRAFCGYVCPLGTLSEWLHGLGRLLRMPSLRVLGRVDRCLASLKYFLLVAILAVTWAAGELLFRGFDPCYALISRHGEDITVWAYVVLGAITLSSLVVITPFCRWLCPFAAVLNPFSRFGFARIKRDTDSCVDCGLCRKACPAEIPVERFDQVKAARCLSCMNCIDACRHKGARIDALKWGPPNLLGGRWSQAVLIAIVMSCLTTAVAGSYLFPLPSFVKSRGTPPALVSETRLRVENLTCRGRGNLFVYFLERDDMWAVPGYLKVEAWPGPGMADVTITFDPSSTDENAVKQAITEPYYDATADFWRESPFSIEGYDPFLLDDELLFPGL